MSVCGCGDSGAGQANNLIDQGHGIRLSQPVSITNPPTTIWACSATAWVPFLPDTQNFTLGASTINESRWLLDTCYNGSIADTGGSTLDITYDIKFAAGATWSATEWGLAFPIDIGEHVADPQYSTSNILASHQVIGQWTVWDDSASLWYKGRVFLAAPTTDYPVHMRFGDDSGGQTTTSGVRQGVPITFAANDELSIVIRCEVKEAL